MPRFTYRVQNEAPDTSEYFGELSSIGVFGESKAIQSAREDCDINVLVARFGITDGAIPPAVADPRFYGDFSDVVDFRDALDRTRAAQEHFDALPASIRERFLNDPLRLYEFVSQESNADEAVELGLLSRRPDPEVATVRVVQDAPPVPPAPPAPPVA